MAKPTYYPDWATVDTTLPATNKANKVRPKETIRTIGWDKGQIPTAEEFNWQMNNYGQWIHYLVDEFIPTLPNTYLPLTGTKVTFSGDLTGNITWNGTAAVNSNIQVVDNSHNHLSANITDASTVAAPNVIPKMDSACSLRAGDIYSYATAAADNASYFFQSFTNVRLGEITSYISGGVMSITRNNPSNGTPSSGINLYDGGYITMNSPRSLNGQEGVANALVRFDYLTDQINSVNNNSTGVYVRAVRMTGGGTADNGNNDNTYAVAPSGAVVTAVTQKTNYTAVQYKYLQYNINNNWYTVGVS